jgi:Flp pilus assembly pilin Flp
MLVVPYLHALRSRLLAERGQTMAEYAVVLALVTVIILTALTALAGGIEDALTAVTSHLP